MVEAAPTLDFPGTFNSQISWEQYLVPELGETRVVILKKFINTNADCFLEAHLHGEACKASEGVVYLYNHPLDNGSLTMRLEYCALGSLLDVMRTRTADGINYISEPKLIQMFRSMLTTISEVHAFRIAHRNIECSNWLVTQAGELKLTDFGIAKLVQNKDTVDVHTIRPGAKNISRYLLENRRLNEFSEGDVFAEDIWALGKVFLELMTLKVYLNVNAQQETELAQFIETKRVELSYSPTIGRVITRMLADPPRPRCNELLQLLGQSETAS